MIMMIIMMIIVMPGFTGDGHADHDQDDMYDND